MSDSEPEPLTEVPAKWKSLEPLLTRTGPYVREGFEPDPDNFAMVGDKRILCVGAGGLGCELLKNLALSGFNDIEVIDLDTIDISNLNRQFLFREKDVGQPKAKAAAEFIMNRCKGVEVKWHNKPIQEFPRSYYRQFDLVIAGLDNVAARTWLNETLCDLVQYDADGDLDYETLIPLIDGGTEGFKGQTRMFLPHLTSCFECSLKSMVPSNAYPSCTIRNVPRLPEHCIIYALKVNWPRLISFISPIDYEEIEVKEGDDTKEDESGPEGVTLDKDNLEHMSWLFNKASERAKQFGIEGVTFTKTQQVVKNIIPAIASTNALVSAACVSEAFKYLSWSSSTLNNYFFYLGHTGISGDVFKYPADPGCRACHPMTFCKVDPSKPFSELCEMIKTEKGFGDIKTILKVINQQTIFLVIGGENSMAPKQAKPISEVLDDNTLLLITCDKYGIAGRKAYIQFAA